MARKSKTAPAKPKGFWDEDDEPIDVPTETVPEPVKKSAPASTPAKDIRVLPASKPTPEGFFSITCGDHRVVIVAPLLKDWADVFCWDYDMGRSMHVHRRDLHPKERVDAAIEYLKNIIK